MPTGTRSASRRVPLLAILRFATLIFLGLTTAGCWDRVEVNDLAIVEGVALDKAGPHSIELTLSIVVPAQVRPPGASGGGGAGGGGAILPPTMTKTTQGRTVMDAIGDMQAKLSRRLFWAHNSVILIGEDLARDGVTHVLDFFSRHRQPRLRALVAVVPGKARDILAAIPAVDKMPSLFVNKASKSRASVAVTLRDFLDMLASDGVQPVAARVAVVNAAPVEPGDLELQRAGKGSVTTAFHDQPAITGSAIFREDQLVGYLDDKLTRGLLWLRNELHTATVTITLGEPDKRLSLELVRSQTILKPRFEGDRIVMEVHISTEDDLYENAARVDTSDPDVLRLLEQELAETITVRIQEAVHVVQKEFRSDVLGFGKIVQQSDPQRWAILKQQWDEVFPEVELDLNVKAFIRRTGLSTQPLGLTEGELLSARDLRTMLEGK